FCQPACVAPSRGADPAWPKRHSEFKSKTARLNGKLMSENSLAQNQNSMTGQFWRVTSDERASEHCLLRLLLFPQQVIGEVPNLGSTVFVEGGKQACELGGVFAQQAPGLRHRPGMEPMAQHKCTGAILRLGRGWPMRTPALCSACRQRRRSHGAFLKE